MEGFIISDLENNSIELIVPRAWDVAFTHIEIPYDVDLDDDNARTLEGALCYVGDARDVVPCDVNSERVKAYRKAINEQVGLDAVAKQLLHNEQRNRYVVQQKQVRLEIRIRELEEELARIKQEIEGGA